MTNRPSSFGPWTISLDNGSRLELSAFWTRRMQALAALPGTTHRLPRRVFVGALVAAALLAAAPLVNFSPARAAPDDQAAPPAEGAFVAKFSNGAEVELIGLSMNPSTTEPFWRPDGRLLDERPYARFGSRMNGADATAREVCYRVRGNGDPDIMIDWNVTPNYTGCGDGPCRDANGQEIPGLRGHAFSLPGRIARCTMRFTMTAPDAPWTNFRKLEGVYIGAFATTGPGGEPSGAILAKPIADRDGTTIVMGYKLPRLTDVRLVITDKQGEEHMGVSEGGSGMMDFMQRSLFFPNLPPAELDVYTIQTRSRRAETIEFRNVSLLPGEETVVEIVALDEQSGARRVEWEGEADDQAEQSETTPRASTKESP